MAFDDKKVAIDQRQAQINAHGKISNELKRKINYKFRLDWNYYSNSMEGNTLTMPETHSVMIGNISIHGKSLKDVLEIKGHDDVISKILDIGKGEVRLSETRIKAIHRGIMYEDDPAQAAKIGVWKTEHNCIYNHKGEKFEFVPPYEVAERMHTLLDKTNADIDAILNNKKNAAHPIDVALQFHLEYLLIHPFYDGNGRAARILTNLLLIAFGYPPFWVKAAELDSYHQYIGEIQGYGAVSDLFMDFAADLILRSQQLTLDAIAGKDIYEPSDLDKELSLLAKALEGNHTLETSATQDLAFDALEFNLLPLFALLEEKCNVLKSAFFDTNRHLQVSFQAGLTQQLSENNNLLENSVQDFIHKNRNEKDCLLSNINYSYTLQGFKKTVSARSFFTDIRVYFDQYNYSIKTYDKEIQLPYGKILSEEERINIITPLVKKIIEAIKNTTA